MSAGATIEKEIFPKKIGLTKWRKIRLFFYLSVFFVVFAPLFLPMSFAPEILHDLLGGRSGALTTALTLFLFILCIVALFFIFLYESAFRRSFNKLLLLEIFAVPLLLAASVILAGKFIGDIPQKIVSINNNRQPEEFNNPYLGYKMLDCRNLTEEFDVIFVPPHWRIETEYLAYAPRRKEKTIDYLPGRKYGDDWYWESSGSQWSDDLRNCNSQNKSPNP